MNQNSDTCGQVLVTGATGDVGSQIVRLLTASGVPVRALYRRDDQRQTLAAMGATPVRGSFEDSRSLDAAMEGCGKLFLLTPPVPQQAEMDVAAIDAARRNRIEHVVRLSAGDSQLRTEVPWARAHACWPSLKMTMSASSVLMMM